MTFFSTFFISAAAPPFPFDVVASPIVSCLADGFEIYLQSSKESCIQLRDNDSIAR